MSIKFTVKRDDAGRLDFSERAMARACSALSSEPYLPKSAKDAVDEELIRLTREIAERNPLWFSAPDKRSGIYIAATSQVMRDHPNLLAMSVKSVVVPDDDYLGEVRIEVDDDDTSSRSGRPTLRRAV